jgi:hypothetical protein
VSEIENIRNNNEIKFLKVELTEANKRIKELELTYKPETKTIVTKKHDEQEVEIKRLRDENNRLQRISYAIAQELDRYKLQSKLAK